MIRLLTEPTSEHRAWTGEQQVRSALYNVPGVASVQTKSTLKGVIGDRP